MLSLQCTLLLCILAAAYFTDGVEEDAASTVMSDDPAFYDVIVIGAGMAGLTAARVLLDQGVQVMVLEGDQRYGGRVMSMQVPELEDMKLEMGVQWITRASNPNMTMHALLNASGIVLKFKPNAEVTDAHYNYLKIEDHAFEVFTKYSTGDLPDVPLSDSMVAEADEEMTELMQKTTPYWQRVFSGNMLGGVLEEVSTKYFWYDSNVTQWVEGDDMLIAEGQSVQTILDSLIEQSPAIEIKYGHFINSIRANPDFVELSCNSGSQFVANHVIVTASLGVLKSGAIEFDPPLDEGKQNALNGQKFGAGEVVFLIWKESIPLMGNDGLPVTELSFDDTAANEAFVPMQCYTIKERVCRCEFGPEHGAKMANMTTEEIKENVLDLIQRYLFPNENNLASYLAGFYRSDWLNNKFILGTNSYPTVGANEDGFFNWHQPHMDRVHFAGEHTAMVESVWAELEGSYLSGLRAADDVMEMKDSV